MKKKNGFTVIELLITIIILGLIMIVGINVGRSAMQRSEFTAAVNEFVANFSLARQLASLENRYVAIDFSDDGTFYRLLVQRQIQTPLTADVGSYTVNKTVEPYDGDQFITGATDFAVNSTGVIRAFPVVVGSNPITVTLTFVKMKGKSTIDYKQTLRIYPSGGIKIEKAESYNK